MTLSLEGARGSEQLQEDCIDENFVHKTAISQIDLKTSTKNSNFDHFNVDKVMWD